MSVKRKAEHVESDACDICMERPAKYTCRCESANCLQCLIEYFKHDHTLPRCPNCREYFKFENIEPIFKSKTKIVIECIKDKLVTHVMADHPFLTNVYHQSESRLTNYMKILYYAITIFTINAIRENRNLRNTHYINSQQFMLAMLANNCKNKKQDLQKYINSLKLLQIDMQLPIFQRLPINRSMREAIANEIELAESVTDEHQKQASAIRKSKNNAWHVDVKIMPADVDLIRLMSLHHIIKRSHQESGNIYYKITIMKFEMNMINSLIELASAHHEVPKLRHLYNMCKTYIGIFSDCPQIILSSYNTLLTMPCEAAVLQISRPCLSCTGYLNSNYKCVSCRKSYCNKCEELLSATHTCLPSTVESVLRVKTITKPCPHCWTRIEKKSGCDEMYCVVCKCTFNWQTNALQEPEHNPMREILGGTTVHQRLINKLRGSSYVNPAPFTYFVPYVHRISRNLQADQIRVDVFKAYMSTTRSRLLAELDRATCNELLHKLTNGASTEELDAVVDKYYKEQIRILR